MSWLYTKAGEKPDWARPQDEVLYVLTVEDLIEAYVNMNEEGDLLKDSMPAWDDLTENQRSNLIARAQDNLDRNMSDDWHEALTTAILEEKTLGLEIADKDDEEV